MKTISIMRKYILLILSLFIVAISCQKDEEPSLTISSKTEISISNIRSSEIISFTANMDWTAKSSASWCTVSPTSGNISSTKVNVTIDANDTYNDRTCTVTIVAGTLSKTVTINQGPASGLLVSPLKFDQPNDASVIEVTVQHNVEFDVSTSEEWITWDKTRALVSDKLYFNIAKNESYDNRNGSIEIKQKNGTLSTTIKVFQSQEDAVILSDKTQEVSSENQTLEVELKTNVDFEVLIPNTATDWVSYSGTRSLRTETLLLNISENDNDVRTTEVYVKNKATNLRDTLTIIQDKAAVLPTLTTREAYDILAWSAKSGGENINDGRAPILSKGICWSIQENPTIEDFKTDNGEGVEDFEAEMLDLAVKTNYYVRSYATNRVGTTYGNEITFTTSDAVATPIISPVGGKYGDAQTITMTCDTEGAEIRYTLNDADPTETSVLYTGEFVIEESMTIKAKAFKEDWMASSITTEVFEILLDAQIIVGTSNTIQHIENTRDFVFKLNDLNDKEIYFVFSNIDERRPVRLPKLESSVMSGSNINANRSLSALSKASSFIPSGKPSVTEFNNSSHENIQKGVLSPQYKKQLAAKSESLSVGSTEDLRDSKGNGIKSTVRKVVSAHGKNLYIWVADNCWSTSSKKKYWITQEMVDELAPKFLNPGDDNDIYEWVTNAAGDPWGPTSYGNLIDETDDIHIWLMDIDDDNKDTGSLTLGYYFSRDNYIKTSQPNSNEKLMFTIDAVLFGKPNAGAWKITNYWPKELISTLAHEFTHMIYFYQKQILSDQSPNTAINEMSAQCVEDLVANKIESDGPRGVPYAASSAGASNNPRGRIPLYNQYNDYNLLDWSRNSDEGLINYSKTYTLGAYLMRNYGGANFIRELIQNNATGSNSIVEAVNANGGAVSSYGDILQRFGAANLMSHQTTNDAGYKFNTEDWSSSTVGAVTYNLGAINLYNYSPAPYMYDKLPTQQKPGSNLFYKAGSNLNGDVEWYFNGIDKNTKVTVVIK